MSARRAATAGRRLAAAVLVAGLVASWAVAAAAQRSGSRERQGGLGDIDEPTLYDSEGRRDPFRPTVGEGKASSKECGPPDTLQGVLVNEVKLTAIMQSQGGNMAQFEGGPDNNGFFTRVGDEFCDGVVHSIDFENKTVTIRQERDDPRRRLLRPYNDVVRYLYPDEAEDGSGGAGAASGGRGGGRQGARFGLKTRMNTARDTAASAGRRR